VPATSLKCMSLKTGAQFGEIADQFENAFVFPSYKTHDMTSDHELYEDMVDVENILMELIKARNHEELKEHPPGVFQSYPKLHVLSNTTFVCDDKMFHDYYYYGIQQHWARDLLLHYLMHDVLAHPPTYPRRNAHASANAQGGRGPMVRPQPYPQGQYRLELIRQAPIRPLPPSGAGGRNSAGKSSAAPSFLGIMWRLGNTMGS
jgi:hypothetical protein